MCHRRPHGRTDNTPTTRRLPNAFTWKKEHGTRSGVPCDSARLRALLRCPRTARVNVAPGVTRTHRESQGGHRKVTRERERTTPREPTAVPRRTAPRILLRDRATRPTLFLLGMDESLYRAYLSTCSRAPRTHEERERETDDESLPPPPACLFPRREL